jgi:hypothetical protein
MMAYRVGRIEAEAHAFLTSQPHVAAFAHLMIKEREPVVQNVAVGGTVAQARPSVLAASADPGHPRLVAHLLAVFYGDDSGPADYDEGVKPC